MICGTGESGGFVPGCTLPQAVLVLVVLRLEQIACSASFAMAFRLVPFAVGRYRRTWYFLGDVSVRGSFTSFNFLFGNWRFRGVGGGQFHG